MSRPVIRGIDLDPQARCAHWRTPRDVVAIKMRCCGVYYACRDCHDALAGHAVLTWPQARWDEKVVLCGACGHEMSVREYLGCADACPACGAPFNPGCREHHRFYFEMEPPPRPSTSSG